MPLDVPTVERWDTVAGLDSDNAELRHSGINLGETVAMGRDSYVLATLVNPVNEKRAGFRTRAGFACGGVKDICSGHEIAKLADFNVLALNVSV